MGLFYFPLSNDKKLRYVAHNHCQQDHFCNWLTTVNLSLKNQPTQSPTRQKYQRSQLQNLTYQTMPKCKDVPKQVHEMPFHNFCAKLVVMSESKKRIKNLVTKVILLYCFDFFQPCNHVKPKHTLSQYIA